ncbi:3-phosphoshikimate 1-carboxyvinyltransferase [Hippea jasoniae]|uniref:3-phosphoshikimate 1-carboxyvinyltransferase n=1 Tax=Hippea jasoniae TaxID=944479 RepID=UPI00054CF8E5|nr:3-phosphoshikimate 1-carboxyvinyltransferase [Hippea jasoniae]
MAKTKTLRPASDKSISHRAVLIPSLAKGKTVVNNFLFCEDTLKSIKAMQAMGVKIEMDYNRIVVYGSAKKLSEPDDVIYLGNSGTSMRLISGIVAGGGFMSVLTGDASLRKRPMQRIIEPLTRMGASVLSKEGGYAPLAIKGSKDLKPIRHISKIASAQVKSAILLAGLFSKETVEVVEPIKSRNHTENMLKFFGVDVVDVSNSVALGKNREPAGDVEINVPADISSAAYFMVYAAMKPFKSVLLKDVNINPTRDGIVEIFKQCGIDFEIVNRRVEGFEEVADIVVNYTSKIKPFVIDKPLIPKLIDEIPILSVLALKADGVSIIRDARELRKKESDRIKAMVENLRRIGAEVEEFEDGYAIRQATNLKPSYIETYNDHRIAMSFLILREVFDLPLNIKETRSILTSYPNFTEHLNYLNF